MLIYYQYQFFGCFACIKCRFAPMRSNSSIHLGSRAEQEAFATIDLQLGICASGLRGNRLHSLR